MKQFLLWVAVVGACLLHPSASAADTIYINTGQADFSWTNAPQIDAFAFYNSGEFTVYTRPLPFDMESVLNVTNRGLMYGSVGFGFDQASSVVPRRPMNNFINGRNALVEGFEYFGFYSSNVYYYPTFLTVWATNIVNEGVLRVGNAGQLRLEGNTIDCSRGGLEVAALLADPTAGWYPSSLREEYFPDTAIYDIYWGAGIAEQPYTTDTASILRMYGGGLGAQSPVHIVDGYYNLARTYAYPCVAFGYTNINGNLTLTTLTNQDGTLTNVFLPTNIIRQAVYVGIDDTNNFAVHAKFYPSRVQDVTFNTVIVGIDLSSTNVVADAGEESSIYFVDRLASETNLLFGTNLDMYPTTYRPAAYEVARTAPPEYFYGRNGNANIATDRTFLYQQSFSNRFATNFYAGYNAYVDYLAVRPAAVVGLGPLHQPGRIEIVGDQVNLSRTRFRGMGLVSVEAKHLISSSNAVVDSPSLVYNLGSTNGTLRVRNLAKESVLRLSGDLTAWSGLWTNQFAMIMSNWYIDATTNYYFPITNAVEVGIHCLIVGANSMIATQQVIVHDLVAQSTNVFIDDPMVVSRRLLIEADSLTFNSQFAVTNQIPEWPIWLPSAYVGLSDFQSTNIPGVRFLTNNGTMTILNKANYGSDADQPLKAFANHGALNAYVHNIAADEYENTGYINTTNDLVVVTSTGRLEGGRDLASGAVRYNAGDLKFRNYTVIARQGFFLNVTNSLADGGASAPSRVTVQDGFHLLRKPASGNLLGTTFESVATKFTSVPHTWAAEDRGATPEGFVDNAAIGTLALQVGSYAELRFGKPTDLYGTPLEGTYALYVDYLSLDSSIAADPESMIWIDPGFTLYFANSNVDPETLDGMIGGRLRWVKSYAGPTSGTEVFAKIGPGIFTTIRVNYALLESEFIDSDGDGLANAFDNPSPADWTNTPFDGATFTKINFVAGTSPQFRMSWNGAAETVYTVEYCPSLLPADWQVLSTVTNTAAVVRTLTVTDSPPANETERYYRVRYLP